MQIVSSYVYPFNDFARDVHALTPPHSDDRSRSFAGDMLALREYMRATYPQVDAIERGAALRMVFSFLNRHKSYFDSGELAVVGSEQWLISESLLRAAHTPICPFCFGDSARMPTV